MPAGTPDEQKAKVIDLWQKGNHSPSAIEAATGVKAATVSNIVKRAGLTIGGTKGGASKPRAAGKTVFSIVLMPGAHTKIDTDKLRQAVTPASGDAAPRWDGSTLTIAPDLTVPIAEAAAMWAALPKAVGASTRAQLARDLGHTVKTLNEAAASIKR